MRKYDEDLTMYAALRSKEDNNGEWITEVICHDWLNNAELEEFTKTLVEEPGWKYHFMAISDKTLATMEAYDKNGNINLFSRSNKRP